MMYKKAVEALVKAIEKRDDMMFSEFPLSDVVRARMVSKYLEEMVIFLAQADESGFALKHIRDRVGVINNSIKALEQQQ